ncbi:MAG: hypothetical protein K0R39_3731 [Symbiobacteriaceae bacterium]|jgi:hypothetical protein|nr:hypothetical protein [Symbiobacteriaceae bacterium]
MIYGAGGACPRLRRVWDRGRRPAPYPAISSRSRCTSGPIRSAFSR